MCNDCAKILCKDRDKKETCTDKVTYSRANIIDRLEKGEEKWVIM